MTDTERVKFEAAIKSLTNSEKYPLQLDELGEYSNQTTLALWLGWLLKVSDLVQGITNGKR